MRRTAVAALLALSCAEAGAIRAPVVYGEDGRTEVFAHGSAVHRAIAQCAVAVQIHASWIDETDPSDVRITYRRTLGEAKNLCPGERFAEQIEPGTCSGTLVDERHVLTAGHCMDAPDDCPERAWVLGFRYASAGSLARLTSDDVYRCERVVAYLDDASGDHAFVRLDRPVAGHTPARVRREPAGLPRGTPVVLIGHPNGIPMKIDSGGVVTWSSPDRRRLTATADAFDGNSGSGIFDADGAVVAVLASGATDYVDAGGCNRVNVIDPPPADDGEMLTYVGPAIDAFCATGAASPLCERSTLPGDACADAERIEPSSRTIEASLTGYSALSSGSCAGAGPERSYVFTVAARTRLVARAAGFDTVLYLRTSCEGAELACHDDVDPASDRSARIEVTLDPGTYVLFVDAFDASAGAFTLELSFEPLASPDPDGGAPPRDAGRDDRPLPRGCGCRAAPQNVSAAWLLLGLAMLRRRR